MGTELVDAPDGDLMEAIRQTPCDVDWCTAKRRRRVGQSKYSPGRLEYPEDCGDRAGPYDGLVHESRLAAAARKKT